MGTSIGAALDYLIDELPSALGAIVPEVVVADGWPEQISDSYVVIGRTNVEDASAADGNLEWIYVGQGRIEETYQLPGYIECTRPGPSQKPARQAVLDLWDGLVKFIHDDPSLGGLIDSGRVALPSMLSLGQTADAGDTGASGQERRAVLPFEIRVQHTYIP
jgi:hypothetical protein